MRPETPPIIINPSPTIPVLANIPHSSSVIPEHVRSQFIIADEELREENRKLVDWFTDELYSPISGLGGTVLTYGVSRFVCDPERFEDDSQECMAPRGMGVLYTHGTHGQRIRRELSSDERERVLNEFYRPYHKAMTDSVAHIVEKFGRCTFIDCHSYPEKVLPYELYADVPRPDVVLGDDSTHTPAWLGSEIERLVKRAGYSFGLNRPFAGTMVPLLFYGDTRVTSFMLEINRATYMDEVTTTRVEGFSRMRALIEEIGRLAATWGRTP
jgi:N-formylglutamate amidohydrolase